MKEATIEVTRHLIEPTGGIYYTYKWIGEKDSPVYITGNADVSKLPWKLIEIDFFPERNERLFIRANGLLSLGFAYVMKKTLLVFYYKAIATLMVWGLAYTPPGNVPSWRDIGRNKR